MLKARNLPKMDVTGLADPYVKIYLLYNQQRIAKKKTHVKKRTLSPVFNESFVFDIPNGADGLNNVSLEFMLLDWDRVTKNEVNFTFLSFKTWYFVRSIIDWINICFLYFSFSLIKPYLQSIPKSANMLFNKSWCRWFTIDPLFSSKNIKVHLLFLNN